MMIIDFKKPLDGTIQDITKTPDDVFSAKMLGPGFVFFPINGKVYAPFDCEVATVFPTGHSIALVKDSLEVLIHVGINTVLLKGEGFFPKVKAGDKIKKNDLILEFDISFIESKGYSVATPVVFLQKNSMDIVSIKKDIYKLQIK